MHSTFLVRTGRCARSNTRRTCQCTVHLCCESYRRLVHRSTLYRSVVNLYLLGSTFVFGDLLKQFLYCVLVLYLFGSRSLISCRRSQYTGCSSCFGTLSTCLASGATAIGSRPSSIFWLYVWCGCCYHWQRFFLRCSWFLYCTRLYYLTICSLGIFFF